MNKTRIAQCAVLACGIACLSATVTDDFTAAGVSTAWQMRAFSGGAVTESGGKLLFSRLSSAAESAARDGSVAGYLCKTHKLVLTQPWTMEMDYALTLPAMVGDNSAGAGGIIQFGYTAATASTLPRLMNGYTFYACRTSAGYRLMLSQFSNGEFIDGEETIVIPSSGRIKLVYTSSPDALKIYVNNVLKRTYASFRTQYASQYTGTAHFGIGGASVEDTSFHSFSYKVAIDNFTISGNGVVTGQ
ncbi:MAG: hypothetical protein ACKOEL_08730 [Planctomycetota bacterium]